MKLNLRDKAYFVSFATIGSVLQLLEYYYIANVPFGSPLIRRAYGGLIATSLLFYPFLFVLYTTMRQDRMIRENIFKYSLAVLVYLVGMQSKIFPHSKRLYYFFTTRFGLDQTGPLFNIESTYRIHVLAELTIEALPLFVVITANNNMQDQWYGAGALTMLLLLVVALKDVSLLFVFFIKLIYTKTNEERAAVTLRPYFSRIHQQRLNSYKLEAQTILNLKTYLEDGQNLDELGNTTLHQHSQFGNDVSLVTQEIEKCPLLLLLLNKEGLLPLDLAVIHNHQEKVDFLLKKMTSLFNQTSAIKYSKLANRLHLQFQRSLLLAVRQKNEELLYKFPRVEQCIVNASPDSIDKEYTCDVTEEVLSRTKGGTDPRQDILIQACSEGNIEAVKVLLNYHKFDVNVNLKGRTPLSEALHRQTSLEQRQELVKYLMTFKDIEVNQQLQHLPLYQVILSNDDHLWRHFTSGCCFLNIYVRNPQDKHPLHLAGSLLNMEVITYLIENLHCPPLLPDSKGNTFLHLLCIGDIGDKEYDFIKAAVDKFQLRLTRNKENLSPLTILKRQHVKNPFLVRGQPNYKRILIEYFEARLREDVLFEDYKDDNLLHQYIKADEGVLANKLLSDNKAYILSRNCQGKTPLMLAVEHKNQNLAIALLYCEDKNNLLFVDSLNGDTALHIAAKNQDAYLFSKIVDKNPLSMFSQNYNGDTPLHYAFFFDSMKGQKEHQAIALLQNQWIGPLVSFCEGNIDQLILTKNSQGENPLFAAIRGGDLTLLKRLYQLKGSQRVAIYRARGEINYKGQTLEHLMCELKVGRQVLRVADFQPDQRDYSGIYPLQISCEKNDQAMILEGFLKIKTKKKGSIYEHLLDMKNYKREHFYFTCAKHDSLEALQTLVGDRVFFNELLSKNYMGDTPIHKAVKNGSLKVLQFFLERCTLSFLEVQNDLGQTPWESGTSKLSKLESNLLKQEQLSENVTKCMDLMDSFGDFLSIKNWNSREFNMSYKAFEDSVIDDELIQFLQIEEQIDFK